MNEPDEYIEILKEQLEDKSRLVEALVQQIKEKDQIILLQKELLKGNSRELGH